MDLPDNARLNVNAAAASVSWSSNSWTEQQSHVKDKSAESIALALLSSASKNLPSPPKVAGLEWLVGDTDAPQQVKAKTFVFILAE
jgi:hypothetical protein